MRKFNRSKDGVERTTVRVEIRLTRNQLDLLEQWSRICHTTERWELEGALEDFVGTLAERVEAHKEGF